MKLNYKRTFIVGLAFLSISAFWQLYDHVVPLMLKYTFDIGDTVSGIVMAADNILALFLLPIFGALSDRTKTRWGRRMPYIVVGSFCAAVVMLLIPVSDRLASLPMFVVGLGLTLLLMASYRSPAVALMPDVTIKPLRSKANAVINLMGAVGGIIILGLTALMLPGGWKVTGEDGLQEIVQVRTLANGVVEEYKENFLPVYLCLMGMMVISTLVLIIFIREPKLTDKMRRKSVELGIEEKEQVQEAQKTGKPLAPQVKRSMGFLLASIALWFMGYNAITTAFSKYCVERYGITANGSAAVLIVAQAAAIVSFIPVGMIATRIGRRKTIMSGVALLALSFAAGALFDFFSDAFSAGMYVLFVLAGIAWASINVNSYPMVVEMAHDGDVGKFTGYYYIASMAAQTITPALSGAALEFIGYHTLFPYGTLFVALSFVTMLFVKHGDAKPIPPASKLEVFNALDD